MQWKSLGITVKTLHRCAFVKLYLTCWMMVKCFGVSNPILSCLSGGIDYNKAASKPDSRPNN